MMKRANDVQTGLALERVQLHWHLYSHPPYEGPEVISTNGNNGDLTIRVFKSSYHVILTDCCAERRVG